ncbi:hypothetical protein SGRIM128S_03568 [Streptomyces griseomycini]
MTAEAARRWASALDSVVVYAQGALCRRLARGRVPADGRVRVAGLPRSLDPGSLRVRVVGTAGARVAEARVEVEAESLDTGVPDELQREVERLQDEFAAAQDRRDRQLGLIEEVGALRPVPPARRRDDPHRRTPVDAWLELADFVDERLTGLHGRLLELEEELRRVEHELTVAVDRHSRASTDAPSAHVETAVCAVLALDGAGDTEVEVEVEVEYGVPGAVWVPAYRLTHRQGDDEGRLLLRASVAQRTGEDWTGVRIALATADLRRRTDLPRLRSARIGRRQPAPTPSGWREPPAGLADLFAGYDAAGPRPDSPATPVAVAGPASRPALFRRRHRCTTAGRPRGSPPPAARRGPPPSSSAAERTPPHHRRPRPDPATGRVPAAGSPRLRPRRPPQLPAGPRRHRRRHPRPLPGPWRRLPRPWPGRPGRAAPNSTTPPSSCAGPTNRRVAEAGCSPAPPSTR